MPNHVRNRLTVTGSKEKIEELKQKFSTHYDSIQETSYIGELIYRKKGSDKNVFGWFNEKLNEFKERVDGCIQITGDTVPGEFEKHMQDAWDRFPDFEKVFPMPESLSVEDNSNGKIGCAILTGKQEGFITLEDAANRFLKMYSPQKKECMRIGLIYAENIEKYGCPTWYDWSCKVWGTKWNAYDCEDKGNGVWIWDTAWSAVPKIIEEMVNGFPELAFEYEWADEDTGCNCGRITVSPDGDISFHEFVNESKEAYELAFELRPHYKENYKLIDGEYKYVDEE